MKQKLTQNTIMRQGRKWLLASTLLFGAASFSAQAQTKVWDKVYTGIGGSGEGEMADVLEVVEATPDGGYILAGSSASDKGVDKSEPRKSTDARDQWGDPNFDYWVVKIDAAGNKQWDRTFGGLHVDELSDIYQTSDGGYILVGNSQSDIGGDKSEATRGRKCNPDFGDFCYRDFWVVKIDAVGNMQWERTIGGNLEDVIHSVVQLPDGGYLLAGISTSDAGYDKTEPRKGESEYEKDVWVVRIDANGNKVWDRSYNQLGQFSSGISLALTKDGGVLLGSTYIPEVSASNPDTPKMGRDYSVQKIDVSGNILWSRTYGGGNTDILTSIIPAKDGDFLLGGYSVSGVGGDKSQPNVGESDYWLVKIDAAGNKKWDRTLGGTGNDYLVSVAQAADGSFILGGNSLSDAGGDKTENGFGEADYWIVKVDAAGNKTWDKTLGTEVPVDMLDIVTSVTVSADGGYVVGGYSMGMYITEADYKITKLKDDVVIAQPQLASFSPATGLPGTTVTLTGKHLKTATSILFNGLEAKFKVVNDCKIKVTVPASATTGLVGVKTAGGTVLSKEVFTVLQPSIIQFAPQAGRVGSTVILAGQHLSTAKKVLFNGVAATRFTALNDKTLQVLVPQGATSGRISVVLKGGGKAVSSADFTLRTAIGAEAAAHLNQKDNAAYPNPFTAGVGINLELEKAEKVNLLIVSATGQKVKELSFGELPAGTHKLEWNGQDSQGQPVNNGLYFYKLSANGEVKSGKLIKTDRNN